MANIYDYSGNAISLSGRPYPVSSWDTVCHRGWINAPVENTLPAFYEAKINGYDWVECDIRLTSDLVWVLCHDTTITDVNGDTYTVADETASTITDLVLYANHATYGNIYVPTLEEMLMKASILNLGVVLDIKNVSNATQATLEDIAKIVLSTGMQDDVIYMPATTTLAGYIQNIDKNASFDFVVAYTSVSDLPSLTDYQALLTGANTVAFDIAASVTDASGGIDATLLDAIRAAGLNISYWNVNTTNYITYMDSRPLRITKGNSADAVDLNTLYLANQTYY